MKIKRYLFITSIILTFTLALTGCNNPGSESVDRNEGEKPYEIVWYDMAPPTRDTALVVEEMSKYTLEKIGVTVKYVTITGSEYAEKMRMMFASNEKFDLCFTSTGQKYEINAANNAFLDVDDLLDKYGKEMKDMLPEYVLEGARINGKLYAVPAYKDYAQESVFYYRGDLADKYGFDMDAVKTLADLEPILKKIKESESVYPLLFLPSGSPFRLMPYDNISGSIIGAIDMNGDPSKIINPFDTPEAMEYFKTMHSFYKQGFMRSDIATAKTNDDIAGDEFMSVQSELPYLIDQRNVTFKHEYRVLHLSQPYINTGCIRGVMTAISRTSGNPQKAMELMNLFNTDPYLRNLAAYGIEGKHYIAIGDMHFRYPDGVSTRDENDYYTYVFTQGNKYISRMIEGTPNDIYDKYKEFDANAIKSPALGFAFDPETVTAEYSMVSSVYNEFLPSLLSGVANPVEFLPNAQTKLKEAGLDTLLAEMQKQYDAWMKAK